MFSKKVGIMTVSIIIAVIFVLFQPFDGQACDLFGVVCDSEGGEETDLHALGYNFSCGQFRTAAQTPDQGDIACNQGWGVIAFAYDQDSYLEYRTNDGNPEANPPSDGNNNTQNVWHSYNNGGIHIDYTDEDFNIDHANEGHDDLYLFLAHARYSPNFNWVDDPHPFIYQWDNNSARAMAHNGGIEGSRVWLTFNHDLINGINWDWTRFDDCEYAGTSDANEDFIDSELYGMLLMFNLCIGEHYYIGEEYRDTPELWAIQRTISQIVAQDERFDEASFDYTSLNILFTDGEKLVGVRQVKEEEEEDTHRLWYNENSDGDNWYILSRDRETGPSYSQNQADGITTSWTELEMTYEENEPPVGEYIWFDKNGNTSDGAVTLEEVNDPVRRHPRLRPFYGDEGPFGRRRYVPNLSVGPNSNYALVWESFGTSLLDPEDYNLHGRILDNLGFCYDPPFDILIDSSRVIQNADVCFDQETNDFYVVYEALNPDSNTSTIEMFIYEYDDEDDIWETTASPTVIHEDTAHTVSHPSIAVDDGTYMVAWMQEYHSTGETIVRAYADWDGGSMSERTVGTPAAVEDQFYPDVIYTTDDESNPLFIVSFTQFDRTTGQATDGVYVSSVSPKTAGALSAEKLAGVSYKTDFPKSQLTVADDHFICAYADDISVTNMNVVSQRSVYPTTKSPSSGWSTPIATKTLSFLKSSYEIEQDISVAGRETGGYDLVYMRLDKSKSPDETWPFLAEYPDYGGSDPTPEMVSENPSYENTHPYVCVSPDIDPQGSTERRLIVWFADSTGTSNEFNGILGDYDPPHFTTSSSKRGHEITQEQEVLPGIFEFDSVYPNPFNSTTRVQFELFKSSHVKVGLYNINGQLITGLLDRKLESGNHSILLHNGDLASGMYFIQMTADRSSQVRKVILLR